MTPLQLIGAVTVILLGQMVGLLYSTHHIDVRIDEFLADVSHLLGDFRTAINLRLDDSREDIIHRLGDFRAQDADAHRLLEVILSEIKRLAPLPR